jgi:hypothetical protein
MRVLHFGHDTAAADDDDVGEGGGGGGDASALVLRLVKAVDRSDSSDDWRSLVFWLSSADEYNERIVQNLDVFED